MTTLSDFDVHLYTASDDVMEMDGALRNGSVVSGNGSVVSGNGSRLVDISGGNGSYDDEPVDVSPCSNQVPYSSELFRNQGVTGIVVTSLLWLCVLLILLIYVDEVVFIVRNFQKRFRKQKTVYILGLPPVYATCAIIGVMIPRAGILVDLVSNSYFGLAMYSWMSLVGDYLGTERRAQAKGVTVIRLSTLPCCCFFVCLPKPVFNRRTYTKLLLMVYQVTLIRPSLAFISAVLWADGQYVPGLLGNNAFTYLASLNIVSTLVAIWGLVIVQRAFKEPLQQFRIGLKFLVLQLTLLGTLTGNIVIAVLVSKNVIPCSEFIPSGARAGRLDNSFLIMWMFLLSILGRIAFRRKQDGLVDTPPDLQIDALNECSGSPGDSGLLVLDKQSTNSLDQLRNDIIITDKSPEEDMTTNMLQI